MYGSVRCVFVLLWTAALMIPAAARDTLMTCSSVRSMSAQEAGKFWRVDLRAVVVCRTSDAGRAFVIQDGTGCVFVELSEKEKVQLESLHPGRMVNVRGFTISAGDSPRVKADGIVLGETGGMPAPVQLEAGELWDGKYEDRYVEFNAVVRSREEADGGLILRFGPGNRGILAKVRPSRLAPEIRVKPDDLVRVRGVVMSRGGPAEHAPETVLIVEEENGLEVLFTAPDDPFSIGETPLSVLLVQPHDPFLERRRKIAGVVTLFWEGRLLAVQSERHAIRITPPAGMALRPGDEVMVAGIPTLYADGLLMEQAVISRAAAGHPPEPEAVSAKEIAATASGDEMDGRYLALGGVVVETGHRERDQVISVESGGGIFRCLLPKEEKLAEGVKAGAYVEVSGVCRLLYGWEMGSRRKDFELLLPDAAAVRVRTVPSWWTPWRLAAAFAVSSLALAGLVMWAVSLRRKVRVRTELLAREMRSHRESELIAGERSRLAMELHDGISQVLSAAAFQLEAAGKGTAAEIRKEERLQLAKRLLEHGREDLRRAVWDLTPGPLENSGFTGALAVLAEETGHSGVTVAVKTSGDVDGIASRIRSHLFRIIQEAVANAVRHGAAETIAVELEVDDGWITARVRDDGSGFVPGGAPGPEVGHFGLYSMKSRAAVLKGTLSVESSAAGTSILVRVPADGADAEFPEKK